MSMTNRDIVFKLREPNRKGGPPVIGIWIAYDKLGIQFEFEDKDWNNIQNKIELVILYLPS